MTCMATPEQTCIVQVILEHEEAFNLRQHRRNETMLKKRILDFIHQLRQRGFRHFIIFINTTVDFWLAELLYFMNRGDRKAAFSYSLYLTPADAENMSEWPWKNTILMRLFVMPQRFIGVAAIGICRILR